MTAVHFLSDKWNSYIVLILNLRDALSGVVCLILAVFTRIHVQ